MKIIKKTVPFVKGTKYWEQFYILLKDLLDSKIFIISLDNVDSKLLFREYPLHNKVYIDEKIKYISSYEVSALHADELEDILDCEFELSRLILCKFSGQLTDDAIISIYQLQQSLTAFYSTEEFDIDILKDHEIIFSYIDGDAIARITF